MDFYHLETIDPLFFYKAIQYFAHQDPKARLLWAQLSPGHYSLGAGQSRIELNFTQAKSAETMILRRPSGGGLVWVEQEYVFACLLPLKHPLAKDPIILQWMQRFYQHLHVDTTLIYNDLWQGGRKLAGSASADLGQHWLFTSSFLQKFSVEKFTKYLIFKHPLAASWFSQAVNSQMTDATTLGVALDFVQASRRWQQVLKEAWGQDLVIKQLSAFERQHIEKTESEAEIVDDLYKDRRLPCAYKIRQGSYLFDEDDLLLWLSDGIIKRLAMPLPFAIIAHSPLTFWQDLQAQPEQISLTTFQCFQKFWQRIHDEYPNY